MRLLLALFAVPVAALAQTAAPFSGPVRLGDGTLCTERQRLRLCLTDAHIVASIDDAEVGRWPAGGFGAQADLRAFALDLDDDGDEETVVAHREAVSNGLAVATWTVYVVEDEEDLFVPAYSFAVRDFSPRGGSFAVRNGRPLIWATEWLDADDPSGRRGPGYYLVGRPFVLTRTGLEPALDLPLRSRRLLYDFRVERGGPVAWLSDRRAETRRTDPFDAGRPGGTSGTIEAVEDADDGYRLTLRLGERTQAALVDPWARTSSEVEAVVRLGDGASGRVFPVEYRPAHLVGRQVRLGAAVGGRHVLWLD